MLTEKQKQSREKAAKTKQERLLKYDQKTAKFHIDPTHENYSILKNTMSEYRAIYNTIIALQRESHAYKMTQWCQEKIDKTKPGEERTKLEAALKKWNKNHDKLKFNVATEMSFSDWAKENWLSSAKYTPELVQRIIAYRSHHEITRSDVKLNSKVIQNTLVQRVNRTWSTYRSKKSDGYGLPSFKSSRFLTLDINLQVISKTYLKNGMIAIMGVDTGVRLGDFIDPSMVQSCKLVMENDRLRLDVVYNVEKNTGEAPRWLKERRMLSGASHVVDDSVRDVPLEASIDPGVNNLLTVCFNHAYLSPLSYDGSYLKSLNQGANRKASKLSSVYKREGVSVPVGKKGAVWGGRKRRVEHELRSVAADLVSRLFFMGVERVIFGWNEGFKQSLRMGRRANQRFAFIPLARLRDFVVSYCGQVGIEVEVREESYSSQASFLDRDFVPVYDKDSCVKHVFSGYRFKRGLYKSFVFGEIHADVNGAGNLFSKSNRQVVMAVAGRSTVVVPVGVPEVWRPRSSSQALCATK